MLGRLNDARAKEALDIVESRRRPDGRWQAEGHYLRKSGRIALHVEVVDWGWNGPNEMITLNALRVLKSARRIA